MSDHDEKDRMTPDQFRKFQKLSNDQYAEIKGTGQQTPEMAARFVEQHKALRAERDRENQGLVNGPGGNKGGQGGSGQGDAKGSLKDHKVDNGQQDAARGDRHTHKLSEFRQNRNDITGQADRNPTRDGTEHPGAKLEPRLDGTRPKAEQQADRSKDERKDHSPERTGMSAPNQGSLKKGNTEHVSEHGATPQQRSSASVNATQQSTVQGEVATPMRSKFLGPNNSAAHPGTAGNESTANQPSGSLKNERSSSSSGQETAGDRAQRTDSLRSKFNENSSSSSKSGSQDQGSSHSAPNNTSTRPENQERKR